jgi:hypothetical protein
MLRFLAALLVLFGLATVICAQRNEGANAPARAGGLGPGISTGLPRTDERWDSRSVTGKLLGGESQPITFSFWHDSLCGY